MPVPQSTSTAIGSGSESCTRTAVSPCSGATTPSCTFGRPTTRPGGSETPSSGPCNRALNPSSRERRAAGSRSTVSTSCTASCGEATCSIRCLRRVCRTRISGRASSRPWTWTATCSRSSSGCGRDSPRPHLVRQHGAAVLRPGRRGRGDRRSADGPERPFTRRRDRPRPDLVDRVRPPRGATPHPAAPLRVFGGCGRLDPTGLARAARPDSARRRHARERDLRSPRARASPRRGACPPRREGRGSAPHRRRGAEERLRGSDSASRPGAALARADRPSDGLCGVRLPRSSARRRARAGGRPPRGAPRSTRESRAARAGSERALRLSGWFLGTLLREAPLQLRAARTCRAPVLLRARPRRRRARRRPRASLPRHRAAASMTTAEILDKALSGERISDQDALALLGSRDLVSIGRAADELRNRKVDARRITFVIDRNVNYTNVCHTDCDFCAFYRRPGDRAEGYLLPKQVIFKKIEETLAIGGTALLMQGGHHPDLGVDFYEDLFSAIKARYKIHLHALSPPEVQHIARRSKISIPATLTRLRDAGLDSLPGGGAEILVDRVRDVIAPKKTKSAEWLGVMREAHRLGMFSP